MPRTACSISPPAPDDGPVMWALARAAGALSVNSSYAYTLWATDFATTSAVARVEGEPAGFVTGYRPPREPSVLMIWQIGVAPAHRSAGIGAALLHHLIERTVPAGVTHLDATITPDNAASLGLFSAVAGERGVAIVHADTWAAELFPDSPADERRYRLGPFPAAPSA